MSYKTTTTNGSFNKANPKESQQKAKPTHRKVYRRSYSCHTIHQRPQWTVQTHPNKIQSTSTIKSLLMHPKDPIPDTQKTDIIYHWKCPANNCIAEYIGETNRSLKERVSDYRNQTTSAIRNHISTKHPKAELKRFYNNRQREQHPTLSSKRSTSHLYQRSITQQKHWQSPEYLQYSTNFLNLPHN